jgi:ribosome-binding factor A
MSEPYPRKRKVDELLREALAGIVLTELKDPRLELVTVTGVRATADVRHADVFVTTHGGPDRYADMIAGLEAATGRIRHLLGDRITLKRSPELHWRIDTSIDEGEHIERMLHDTHRAMTGEHLPPSPLEDEK